MRIGIFIFIVIVVVRMIYDLTFNPLEALINIVYKNGSDTKCVAKQVCKITIPIILFAVIWSLVMPGILAYTGRPFEEETHVLGVLPMYGNKLIETKETALGDEYYRYMNKGDTTYSETDKGVRVYFSPTESAIPSLVVTYQTPKQKAPIFFFMDYLTWPKEKKDVQYVFYTNF